MARGFEQEPSYKMRNSEEERIRHGNASTRKKDELHQSRIFANNASYDDGFGHTGKGPNDYLEPFTVDNSNKVKNAQGKGNQNIHQAHLRTSMTPDSFYESAEGAKHWEVTELHLSGLSRNATDATVKEMCQGTDLQIVKVSKLIP